MHLSSRLKMQTCQASYTLAEGLNRLVCQPGLVSSVFLSTQSWHEEGFYPLFDQNKWCKKVLSWSCRSTTKIMWPFDAAAVVMATRSSNQTLIISPFIITVKNTSLSFL